MTVLDSEIIKIDDAVVDQIPLPNRIMAPFVWVGGKGNMAKWIMQNLPLDGVKCYVEPYSGAASVFWHLPKPFPVEVLNDIDKRIVTLFRVLQSPDKFLEFRHRVLWTPYAREEIGRAIDILNNWDKHDDIQRAWAFYVAVNQSIGGTVADKQYSWGRVFISHRGMAETCCRWRGRMKYLTYWHDRLTRVQIDNRDALEAIRYWDSPETLFYVDPPYVPTTRIDKKVYASEPDEEYHIKLVDVLLQVKGQVVLSGYENPIYKRLEESGWEKLSRTTSCHAAGRVRGSKIRGLGAASKHVKRVEVMWVKSH